MRAHVWLVAAVAIGACHPPAADEEIPAPIAVHCTPVARRAIDRTTTLPGRVAAPPGGQLPVASQVAGRIDRLLVHEGDRVAGGAILALIDESASRDALRQADSALLQAKAAQVNATATLERTKQLVARGIAAKQELDDATARADEAQAGVTAATAASDVARRTLGRVQVRSTFEGIVTRIYRGAGALVDGTSATPVLDLASSAAVEFDAEATERDLLHLEPGARATVTLSATGQTLDGIVRSRATALDPTTGLGGVRIALDAPGLTLGLFGSAIIHASADSPGLTVPSDAMRGAVADGAEVVVCLDGKAQLRTIRVGWRDDRTVEVREGLAEGERVAVDHVLGLENDTPLAEAR